MEQFGNKSNAVITIFLKVCPFKKPSSKRYNKHFVNKLSFFYLY